MSLLRSLRLPYRLRTSERGATAIEYGLIAGLIAVGILGSLVTTRTSLNSVFGVTSSNLGSTETAGTAAGASAPLTQAAITSNYWNGKTLVSTVSVTGGKKFTYSDGTTAQYTTGSAAPFNNQLVISDPATNEKLYTWTDASGNPTLYEIEYHNWSGLTGPRSGYDCSAPCSNSVPSTFSGNPPLPTGMVTAAYASNGATQTSYTSTTPTSSFLNMAASGYSNYQYFKALSGL